MLSARSGSCLIASMAAMATYGDGLTFVGLLVPLTSKTSFSASICGITIHWCSRQRAHSMGSASRERFLYGLWTAVSPTEASKVGSAHSSLTISCLGMAVLGQR